MWGGAAPLGLLRLVPASAPDSGAEGGRGAAGPEPGFLIQPGAAGWGWLKVRGRAGCRASARAGGPPSPALAGAQPQGHVERLRRKPSPGEGGESRLGPPLTGEPPPRAAAAVPASPHSSSE